MKSLSVSLTASPFLAGGCLVFGVYKNREDLQVCNG